MWPPQFEQPVQDKSEFRQMRESGEYERKRLVAVQAAAPSATASVFHQAYVENLKQLILKNGKKLEAEEVMAKCFHRIKTIQLRKYRRASDERKPSIMTDPSDVVNAAVENARPLLNLHRVRVGAVM